MKTNIPERIAALREAMKQHKIDAYIIPTSDPHMSEYPADCWKYREWISGFTGSAGTVIITADKAGLWTDSRYFLQASTQLEGTGIELFKMMLPETPDNPGVPDTRTERGTDSRPERRDIQPGRCPLTGKGISGKRDQTEYKRFADRSDLERTSRHP